MVAFSIDMLVYWRVLKYQPAGEKIVGKSGTGHFSIFFPVVNDEQIRVATGWGLFALAIGRMARCTFNGSSQQNPPKVSDQKSTLPPIIMEVENGGPGR